MDPDGFPFRRDFGGELRLDDVAVGEVTVAGELLQFALAVWLAALQLPQQR